MINIDKYIVNSVISYDEAVRLCNEISCKFQRVKDYYDTHNIEFDYPKDITLFDLSCPKLLPYNNKRNIEHNTEMVIQYQKNITAVLELNPIMYFHFN